MQKLLERYQESSSYQLGAILMNLAAWLPWLSPHLPKDAVADPEFVTSIGMVGMAVLTIVMLILRNMGVDFGKGKTKELFQELHTLLNGDGNGTPASVGAGDTVTIGGDGAVTIARRPPQPPTYTYDSVGELSFTTEDGAAPKGKSGG